MPGFLELGDRLGDRQVSAEVTNLSLESFRPQQIARLGMRLTSFDLQQDFCEICHRADYNRSARPNRIASMRRENRLPQVPIVLRSPRLL